jgi:hypothetical protein
VEKEEEGQVANLDKEHVNFGRHEIEVATRPAVGMAFELVPLFWCPVVLVD